MNARELGQGHLYSLRFVNKTRNGIKFALFSDTSLGIGHDMPVQKKKNYNNERIIMAHLLEKGGVSRCVG